MFLSTILMLALSIEAQHFYAENHYGNGGGGYNYGVETDFGGARGNYGHRHPDRPPSPSREDIDANRQSMEYQRNIERLGREQDARANAELAKRVEEYNKAYLVDLGRENSFSRKFMDLEKDYEARGFGKDRLAVRVLQKSDYIVSLGANWRYNDFDDGRRVMLEHSREMFITWGEEVLKLSMDLATGLTPGVSWARDIYEAFSYKDLITGERLGCFQHTLAIAGLLTGGGATMGVKAVNTFTRLIESANRYGAHGRLLYGKSVKELTVTYTFFREHKIWDGVAQDQAADFTNSFVKGAEVVTATYREKVFRFYDPQYAQARGYFVTPQDIPIEDAKRILALPFPVTHKAELYIPAGTPILKGHAAPNFDSPGGGIQYVIDKNLLEQ